MKIVEDFRTEHKSSYYMILCKELSFYTIFAKDNYEKNSLEEAVLDYCISTGPIHSVSLTENNDAIEIWIEYENEVFQHLGSVATNNGYSDWAIQIFLIQHFLLAVLFRLVLFRIYNSLIKEKEAISYEHR